MARQTSIDCYNQIKAEGLLSDLRFSVYDWLYSNGPATAQEVTTGLANGSQDHGSFSTRLSELRDQGAVKECGKVKSKTTSRTVIQWDVTDNLPVKIEKKKTAKQLRLDAVMEDYHELYKLYKNDDPETLRRWTLVAKSIRSI